MTSIKDLIEKIKGLVNVRTLVPISLKRALSDDVFFGLIIILIALGSFGLGRLSKIEDSRVPIRIENEPEITADTFLPAEDNQKVNISSVPTVTSTNQLVGSKSGTKYHYIWCAGAQKISEANRRYFSSIQDAEAQGYTPASNCKGL
ncbi:MAG: hypothetical protein HY228_01765 [Candidatus Yonathbacteria bacterium]|nr:hypothetical protein [Candidatus Yonathbacteria bacterium]